MHELLRLLREQKDLLISLAEGSPHPPAIHSEYADRQGRIRALLEGIKITDSLFPSLKQWFDLWKNGTLQTYKWRKSHIEKQWEPLIEFVAKLADTSAEKLLPMKKTILELDLVGYSTISANIEESFDDVRSVSQLNGQIQGFISAGLKDLKVSREHTLMQTTGDGAILAFDTAAEAHSFAVFIRKIIGDHNAARAQPLAKRIFRMGAATGDIDMQPREGGGFEIAGTTIARAVRLEAKAPPGGLLVDETTFLDLPKKLRSAYGPEQRVSGKRDEVFTAYGLPPNAEDTRAAEHFSSLGQKAPPSPVLILWQEKLEFLQSEEAITTNASMRWEIKKQIEEAKAKINEYRS